MFTFYSAVIMAEPL